MTMHLNWLYVLTIYMKICYLICAFVTLGHFSETSATQYNIYIYMYIYTVIKIHQTKFGSLDCSLWCKRQSILTLGPSKYHFQELEIIHTHNALSCQGLKHCLH